jgi:hypothetical protein
VSLSISAEADIIKLKNSNRTFEGNIINETKAEYIVKLKGGGQCQIPKSWVKKIIEEKISEDELYSDYDIYQKKLQDLDVEDAEEQYSLALWCLKKFLYLQAEEHLLIAKELDSSLADKVDKKLKYIDNINAEIIFAYAQGDMKYKQYLETENTILNLLAQYPDTNYTSQAEDILIIIWGQKRAMEILNKKDSLPQIATSLAQLRGTLSRFKTDELKEAYLKKCFEKARMFEERAEEVADEDKGSYLSQAQRIYNMLSQTATGYIKDYSESKINKLASKTVISYTAPKSSGELSDICRNMEKVKDEKTLIKACNHYFSLGHKYYSQAKKAKGKDKQEPANIAYYCYSIVYYFSPASDLKQEAAKLMQECKILTR